MNLPERMAVVAVIQRHAQFLVVKRALTETAPGAFCFPGGGIEQGESEPVALLRELQEEVGVRQANPVRCIWRCRTERNVNIAWWLTEIPFDATILANPAEVAAAYWWTREEMLASGNMLRSNLGFLKAIDDGEIQLEP